MAFAFAVLLIVVATGLLMAGARARERRKWTSAGGILLDRRGRIALVRQRDRKGRRTPPKGGIDPGETAEQAALREVHEESGMRGRIVGPIALRRRAATIYARPLGC